MSDPIQRRLDARRELLMWRVQMLEAEGFEAEGAEVLMEAMANELEHIEDLMRTMLHEAIARRWNIKSIS